MKIKVCKERYELDILTTDEIHDLSMSQTLKQGETKWIRLNDIIKLKEDIIAFQKKYAGEANAFVCFHNLIDSVNDALAVTDENGGKD